MFYKNILDRCIPPESTIADALTAINLEPEQRTAFVTENGKFKGIITEGDIRRALLAGETLKSPVINIYNKNPIVYTKNANLGFSNNQIYPLVDEGVLIGYYYERFRIDLIDIRVLVMAGGYGTRLRPLTDNTPKPMLKIGGKPILERIIEQIGVHGIRSFVFSTHYLPEVIKNYFQNGEKFGCNILYLHEQHPLGTGGALTLLNFNSDLLVVNGDVLTSINYGELLRLHYANSNDITMAVRDYSHQIPFGVVYGGDKVDLLVEKPVSQYLINTGIYVLSAKVVSELKTQKPPYDMPTAINNFIERGFLVGKYHFDDFWIDIGQPQEYEKAQSVYKEVLE